MVVAFASLSVPFARRSAGIENACLVPVYETRTTLTRSVPGAVGKTGIFRLTMVPDVRWVARAHALLRGP